MQGTAAVKVLIVVAALAGACAGQVIGVDPPTPLQGATRPGAAGVEIELDLGFRDFLDLRLKAEPGSRGTAVIRYSTDAPPDPGAERRLEIPAQDLVRDGRPHTYRLDLGLEIFWRGLLIEIDVETGEGVEALRLELGDHPGDRYRARPTAQNPKDGEKNELGEAVSALESKHFRLLWSETSLEKGFDPQRQARGTLRNLEETWQVLTKIVGLREPAESWTPENRDGRRYKTNVSTWFDGYWAGGEDGDFGRLNVTADGLRVDPPSWVLPHELGHVFQMHQEQKLRGSWWESHADYMTELWLKTWSALDPDWSGATQFNASFAETAHYFTPWGGHYYLCWPIFLYMDENPDGLKGLGARTSTRLWREAGGEHADVWERLPLLTGTSRKEVCGLYARRNVLWDYERGAAMRGKVEEALADEARRRMVHTPLLPSEGRAGWWRVPLERAPQQFAYAVHVLAPRPGTDRIRVDLEPYEVARRKADWRASLVVEDAEGRPRYSELWSRGPGEISWKPGDRACFLVVAATPDDFLFGDHDDLKWPYADHPQRQRFPYELRLEGADPAPPPSPDVEVSDFRRHGNGGGLVGPEAEVSKSAYVGPRARVLGRARVLDEARIEGEAVVRDAAVVRDRAVASGRALIRGRAELRDDARVRGAAVVGGGDRPTRVAGRARVTDHARLEGGARVEEDAIVRGCAVVASTEPEAVVGGHAIVEGDAFLGRSVSSGVHTGFMPWNPGPEEWLRARRSSRELLAAWTFDRDSGFAARDAVGSLDGILRGAPSLARPRGADTTALVLGSDDASMILQPGALDLDEDYAIHVVVGKSTVEAPLLVGRGPDGRLLRLELRDEDGRPAFTLSDGRITETLVAAKPVPRNAWVGLTVLAAGGRVRLAVDGEVRAEGRFTLTPALLFGGESGGLDEGVEVRLGGAEFRGWIDELRIYRAAVTLERVRTELLGVPGLLGRFCAEAPRSFGAPEERRPTPVGNLAAGTLAAWLRPRESRDVELMETVIDADRAGEFGSGFGLDGGVFKVILDDEFWETGVPVKSGRWQHAALVFDAETAVLHIDGKPRARHRYRQGAVSDQRYVIGGSAANELGFQGELFDVRIYDRALSGAELEKLARRTPPR